MLLGKGGGRRKFPPHSLFVLKLLLNPSINGKVFPVLLSFKNFLFYIPNMFRMPSFPKTSLTVFSVKIFTF